MIQCNPYLTFNGNCREAMTFYKDVFGGNLTLQTVAETPMAAQCPTGMQHQIMHSTIEKGSFVLMATDMVGPGGFQPGTDMAIALKFDEVTEIQNCFSRLSEKGLVIDDLKQQPWGALFGVVKDKFDKVWMLECSNGVAEKPE